MLRKNEICIGLGVFFTVLRAKVRCFAVYFFNRKDLFGGEMFVCKRWCDTCDTCDKHYYSFIINVLIFLCSVTFVTFVTRHTKEIVIIDMFPLCFM